MKKGFHWILEGETSKLCVMYRTLVFGADGRVGSRLAAYLEEHGLEVVKCGRGFCDLKDLSALKRVLLSSGATHVVNCAAVSGLEACLDDPETAHCVNAMAPEMMARICRLEGMRFIHLSTDYVLDGRRRGLKTEEGKCRPVNVYGESKLEADFRAGGDAGRSDSPRFLGIRQSGTALIPGNGAAAGDEKGAPGRCGG